MNEIKEKYEHPLVDRYASKEMSLIWSPQKKFSTWRKLWLELAIAEKELGLNITEEQINEMKNHLNDINFDLANEMESKFRHDVMAHIHIYGLLCPLAMPIIHLGATSCYVGDNTDIIQIKESLCLIRTKIVKLLSILNEFADKYKDLPTLGFTHFQPAQLTTVGKRCTLWMYDFLQDYEEINNLIENIPLRGVKGTTGTQVRIFHKYCNFTIFLFSLFFSFLLLILFLIDFIF